MPNEVLNKLTIITNNKTLNEIKEFIRSDISLLDFNKIHEMSEKLNIEESLYGEISHHLLFKKSEHLHAEYDEYRENLLNLSEEQRLKEVLLGIKYQSNIENHGFRSWFDWRIENWGTKWNAYNTKYINDYTLVFQTAWDPITVLLGKLSRKFKGVKFIYEYIEPGIGFGGSGTIMNGSSSIDEVDNKSKLYYDLLFKFFPERKENFIYYNGYYVSLEDYDNYYVCDDEYQKEDEDRSSILSEMNNMITLN